MYIGKDNTLLPLPGIPVVYEDSVQVISPEFDIVILDMDQVPKKHVELAASILDQLKLQPPQTPHIVTRYLDHYLAHVVTDSEGKEYHYLPSGGKRTMRAYNLIEATAYALDKTIPIPRSLHDRALAYLQQCYQAGMLNAGLMHHEDGFSYFGDE